MKPGDPFSLVSERRCQVFLASLFWKRRSRMLLSFCILFGRRSWLFSCLLISASLSRVSLTLETFCSIDSWDAQEGSCVMSGVTFDLKTDSFDKSSNVRVFEYETTSTFGGIIHSFNVTTNRWAAKYVFKRLRFLRSKFLSHILTLVYLALWHGYKSGYYVTFTIEFLIMKVEKDVMEFIEVKRKTNKGFDAFLSHPLVYCFLRVFFRVYTLVVFGYCLVPFLLLNYIKWWDVLQELYFFGHVIYIPAVILAPILLQFLKPRRERTSPTVVSQSESGDKKIN